MKRTLLSLLGFSLLASSSFAQSIFAPEVGLNLANMKVKAPGPTSGTSLKPGILVGANFDLYMSSKSALQPGIFYKMNGANIKSDHTSRWTVNTAEIPINYWYRFGEPGTNQFCLGAGPYIAVNLSSKVTWDAYTDMYGDKYPAGSQNLKVGDKETDDIKKIDFGMGINMAYLLKSGLFFHARYQFGIPNVNPASSYGYSFKTSAIGFSVGYYIKDKGAKSKAKPGQPAQPAKEKKPRKKMSPLVDE